MNSTSCFRKKGEPCWLTDVHWAPTMCWPWILKWTIPTWCQGLTFWGRGNCQKCEMRPPPQQSSRTLAVSMSVCVNRDAKMPREFLLYGAWSILGRMGSFFNAIFAFIWTNSYFTPQYVIGKVLSFDFLCSKLPGFFLLLCDFPLVLTK